MKSEFHTIALLGGGLVAAAASAQSPEGEPAGKLAFGSLLEVEAAAGRDHAGDFARDLTLATVELTAGARVNDWTQAELVYLSEDGAPGGIDQALVTLARPGSPLFVSGGLMYLPFGSFETGMISDPLTLELGETRDSAIMVGHEAGGVYGAVYLFMGDTGTDEKERFGLNLGYARVADGLGFDVGVGYTSSMESDAVTESLVQGAEGMQGAVGGIAAHAMFNVGRWTLLGEYVGASSAFGAADLPFRSRGAQPSALNLELGYGGFSLMGRESAAAVGLQQSSEALAIGLPERKLMAALSIGLIKRTTLSMEYAYAEDYEAGDRGSGGGGSLFTLQLAAEF